MKLNWVTGGNACQCVQINVLFINDYDTELDLHMEVINGEA